MTDGLIPGPTNPRTIVDGDNDTITFTNQAELNLVLKAVNSSLETMNKMYAKAIQQGSPEWLPEMSATRDVMWGHAAVLRKLLVAYHAMHAAQCQNPDTCAAGSETATIELRLNLYQYMVSIDTVNRDNLPMAEAVNQVLGDGGLIEYLSQD